MKISRCVLACVAAVALAATTSTTANAADGAIAPATLSAMGLGGATIVSDDVAGQVRGQGFLPISIAAGGSYAYVGRRNASAGSVNGYLAAGRNFAAGSNGSEAGRTVSRTTITRVFGVPVGSTTRIRSINVYAGGFSSSSAF
ncbi:MAG: hypothetical protein AAGF31_00620 [Planctomycetota bacterium]